MSSIIPASGPISMKQIREYIGLNDTVHLSQETVPLSLRQIFFSPRDSIKLNAQPYLALSSLRGCMFAAYTNSSRSNLVKSSIQDTVDGDTGQLYLGLSNTAQNSGYGQSGLLYTRNRGLPIKLHIQATAGSLLSLNLDTRSGTSNSYRTYSCGSQGGASFQVQDNIHQLRLYTDQNSISDFIIRIIPMLDGKTEGTGEHVIQITLAYIIKPPSSSSEPFFR